MGATTWRRAFVAAAAVVLGAAGVVMAVGDGGRALSAGARGAAESIDSVPHAVALQPTARGRPTHLSGRADDGAAAKGRPILFVATLAAALLLAATMAWPAHPAVPVRPRLHRHRHSLSPRGPPQLNPT